MSTNHRPIEGVLPTAILIVVSVVFSGLLSLKMAPYAPDDAFISYRYAENVANGYGLVFNPGERVEGYSNLLWILAGAGMHAAGISVPSMAPSVGWFFNVLTIVTVAAVFRARQVPLRLQALPLLLLATSGPFLLYGISGMETPLFGFLLVWLVFVACRAFESGSAMAHFGLATVGLLASITRPEGITAYPLVVTVLAVGLWIEKPAGKAIRPAVNSIIAGVTLFLVAQLAFHLWRTSYFGEWLPTPFMSKGGAGGQFTDAWRINRVKYFSGLGTASPFGYYFCLLFVAAAAGHALTHSTGKVVRLLVLLSRRSQRSSQWCSAQSTSTSRTGCRACATMRACSDCWSCRCQACFRRCSTTAGAPHPLR